MAEVYEPIQRYARRRVASHAVDDIVSDTLMTLWRRLDDVPDSARLPWAYGVARHHIANHRRSTSRNLRLVRRTQSEPAHPSEVDGPLDPEIDEAMSALSEGDRELLRLWAWEQLEAAEIGQVMGLTANAAAIRLHRAKKKFGENLETARKNTATGGHSSSASRKEARP